MPLVESLKNIEWNFYEIFIFIALATVIVIFAFLLHYHSINKQIRKESRCQRERAKHFNAGVYSVKGTTADGDNLYKVSYNVKEKTSTLECDCRDGTVQNHFKKIPVYDMKKNTTRYVDKNCACDKNYDEFFGETPTSSVYFEGYPSLIRYMQNQDTGFFMVDSQPQTASY